MMRTLLVRLLPWLTGIAGALIGYWQWQFPLSYPWPLLSFGVWYLAVLVVLSWNHLGFWEALEKAVPSVISLTTLGFGFLMAESTFERVILTVLFAGVPLLTAELLFLLTRDPARYPVNGLSRVNLTLVPVAAFFLASTLNELWVFIRLPWWIGLSAFTMFGAALYAATAHPTADRLHRGRWAGLGGGIGLHLGILGLLLPISMAAHGALAALLLAFPLRVRRYAYQPVPSVMHVWTESILAIIFFVGLLVSSRWV